LRFWTCASGRKSRKNLWPRRSERRVITAQHGTRSAVHAGDSPSFDMCSCVHCSGLGGQFQDGTWGIYGHREGCDPDWRHSARRVRSARSRPGCRPRLPGLHADIFEEWAHFSESVVSIVLHRSRWRLKGLRAQQFSTMSAQARLWRKDTSLISAATMTSSSCRIRLKRKALRRLAVRGNRPLSTDAS
jgi:hypothetical protein